MVSREVKEKQLKFERDPRMRHSGTSNPSANANNAQALETGQTDLTCKPNSQSSEISHGAGDRSIGGAFSGNDGAHTTSDKENQRAIREKQLTAITVTIILMIIVVTTVIVLTG